METKGFLENGFIIDLGNAKDAAEIIYELSSFLDVPEANGKNICLKIGNIDLTQSQLLSVKALISSMDSELTIIDTTSEKTKDSANNLNLTVSELKNEIEVKDIDLQDVEIKEMEVGEPNDGLSYELDENIEVDENKDVEIFEAETETTKTKAEEKSEEVIEVVEETEEQKLAKKEAFESEIFNLPTLYLNQTLRSGQTMTYDGNVVIVGDVKPGSEIIAKGDITIWGVLGGIAHAGARGNDFAKIRALKINAIQLRISGFYARRPDSMNIPFIQRSDTFTPEEARVNNSEIAIYKMGE